LGPQNASYLHNSAAEAGYYGLDNSGQLHGVTGSEAGTRWFQDHLEVGYTQRPGGPKKHEVFRLPYDRGTGSVQPPWTKNHLLSSTSGIFQLGIKLQSGAIQKGDYGGNQEVMPPTPAYPLGRIVEGDTRTDALAAFL